jgi:uncharacterized protein (TIGR02266 family)
MGDERRKYARVSVAVEVDITSEHNFYVGRTRDISAGGLFIETPIGIDIGSLVDVDLSLDGERFSLRSEVMWALTGPGNQTVGVGVRFTDLNDRAKAAIDAFMNKRAPDGIDVEPVGGTPPPFPAVGGKGPPPLPK